MIDRDVTENRLYLTGARRDDEVRRSTSILKYTDARNDVVGAFSNLMQSASYWL